jgi:very-short-patch-repair endonuclease
LRGWKPALGQTRQKDLPRTAARAKRMRLEQTPSEARLWKMLRQLNADGAHFRRQAAVDTYVYDFGDYSARLLIELDGVAHRLEGAALLDAKKNAHAAAQGFRLLRLTNQDVWGRPDWVMRQVRAFRAGVEARP